MKKGLLAKRVYVYKKNVYVYTNYYNIYFFIIILLYYIFYFTLSFHVNDPIQKKFWELKQTMNKKAVSARINEYAYTKLQQNTTTISKSQYIEQAILHYNNKEQQNNEINIINAKIQQNNEIIKTIAKTQQQLKHNKKTLQKQLKQDTINPHQYIHAKKTLQNIKERTGTITQDQYQIQANKLGIPITQLKQLLKEDKQTQRRQETQ